MSSRFVGRRVELALLDSVSSDIKAREMPAAALISGSPGSGKSRLLSEFALRQASSRRLRVAGFETGKQAPLAAAADLLRDLGEVSGAGAILSELLFARDRSLEPLRVFEAARQALVGLRGQVLLAVDDVQWIDELSIALCTYLVRSAVSEQKELTVVAASRPSTETIAFRDSLIRELGHDRVTSIQLGPLDRDDGVQLIKELAPRWSPEQAEELWSQARGSPFWLAVLARGREGADAANYLSERQTGLGADGARLLALLAITTRPLTAAECAGALVWEDPRCRAAITELERSGLAMTHGDRLALAHDLIRTSVMQTLSTPRRRELHAALASWFELQAQSDVQLLHEAIVHRREADLDIRDLALRILESPRRRLLGRSGLQELVQVADSAGLAEPVAVALRLSVAQLASELGEQQIALDRWTSLATEVRDSTLRARAYLSASRAAMRIVERRDEALPLLELAQAQSTDDPVLAVEVESHRANLLQVVIRQAEEGRRAASQAAARARALWGQPPMEITTRERDAYVAALQVAFDAAIVEENGGAQLQISGEISQVGGDSDEGAVWAAHDRSDALMFTGRVGEAIDSGRRAWTRSRDRMLPMLMLTSGANLVSKLLDAGRLSEAEEVVSECLELERRIAGTGERLAMGQVGNWSIHDLRHQVWLSRGDWREALESLEREITRQPEPHFRMHLHWHVFGWLARCGGTGQSHEIDRHLTASRQDALDAGCRRCSRELALKAAEALARLGRIEEAVGQLDKWDEKGRGAMVGDTLWRRHIAALVAIARHDRSGVVELEAVLAERERLGLLASLLWNRLDLAAALQTSDSRRAAEEFRKAGELAAVVGASTEQQLADLGLRRLGVRTWRRGQVQHGEHALDRLSEREKQIAALLGAGHSNPEIASRLFLSRKTIERHVSNILARTGTRNRTELARFLSAQQPGAAMPGNEGAHR